MKNARGDAALAQLYKARAPFHRARHRERHQSPPPPPPPPPHAVTARACRASKQAFAAACVRGGEIETNDGRDDVARAVCSDANRARAPPRAPPVDAAADSARRRRHRSRVSRSARQGGHARGRCRAGCILARLRLAARRRRDRSAVLNRRPRRCTPRGHCARPLRPDVARRRQRTASSSTAPVPSAARSGARSGRRGVAAAASAAHRRGQRAAEDHEPPRTTRRRNSIVADGRVSASSTARSCAGSPPRHRAQRAVRPRMCAPHGPRSRHASCTPIVPPSRELRPRERSDQRVLRAVGHGNARLGARDGRQRGRRRTIRRKCRRPPLRGG